MMNTCGNCEEPLWEDGDTVDFSLERFEDERLKFTSNDDGTTIHECGKEK